MSEEFGDDVYAEPVDGAEFPEGDDDSELDTGYAPPDREPKSLKDGLTDDEQRRGESLDERLSEEVPEVSDEGSGGEQDPRAGRLQATDDEGFGEHSDSDLLADDVGIDGGAASAEEAAVHIRSADDL